MSKKRGLDKYLTPNGFWDRFITFNVLAVAVVGAIWINFRNGIVDDAYFVGLMIGLLSGQAAICTAEFARISPKRKKVLYQIYVALTVVLFFLLIFVFRSARLAGGYFFGLCITLFFGAGLVTLVRSSADKGKR